jgi:DNA-binding YbaB/EbfC family protein
MQNEVMIMVNPNDMNELVKVAQQMQENFKRAHEELSRARYEGVAGAGMLTITQNGKHYVVNDDARPVKITQEAYDLGIEKLEELIAAAFNAGTRRIDAASEEKMVSLSKQMGLPDNKDEK